MFDFSKNVFEEVITIPKTTKVVFVSDMFVEDYVGGAELTSQAIINSSPFEIFKLHSRDVNMNLMKDASDKFWIFGNFANLDPQLIPTIVGNLKYSILEYDYKYCKVRSPEKHAEVLKKQCDCHDQMNGKMVSAFFYGSNHIWWMSEKQKNHYHSIFPFLSEKDNTILSSVFDDQTLNFIKHLRNQNNPRKGWIVLGSNSWIKGVDSAKKWCEENNKDYEVVWNLPYNQILEKLASAEGFVYLPLGGDTCPRMVIEAKLLGCKLQLNENVQHKNEEWFDTDDVSSIEEYLLTACKTFWSATKSSMEYKASISGYTTTFNCVKQQYPFEQCIQSLTMFCDEICVVDGGSTDGTWERLISLAYPDFRQKLNEIEQIKLIEDIRATGVSPYENNITQTKIKLKCINRDWNHPRFAVFDGMQKAEAREMCTKEFCWQMDSDEIVHENDGKKITDLCQVMPKNADILALPVIEYWGGLDKVRMDIQPWKWRLSRNKSNITHGIPVEFRKFDNNGNMYAMEGTDGCDMIDKNTHERLPHISFYTSDVESARLIAMLGNEQARQEYEIWFNQVINGLPCVFHYSWYDLSRKIQLYKNYWTSHWNSLYAKNIEDTADNNMMFDVPWSEVTDEMIEKRADQMKEKLGGWIWHKKWDGNIRTEHIKIVRHQPKIMDESTKQ